MLPLLSVCALAAEPWPVTDPEVLVRTHLETEALWFAVNRKGHARARYARTAVAARKQRIARMVPEVVVAERGVERQGVGSGLALERQYAARDGRARALAVGQAMATLLDDLLPGWRQRPEPLDVLLDEATAGEDTLLLEEDFKAAEEEATALRRDIVEAETEYLVRPGYTLTLNLPMASVDPDPFSAMPLGDHSALYSADVVLEGAGARLAVTGHGAWLAMDEVRIAGLTQEQLALRHDGPDLVVTAPGVDLRVRGAIYKLTRVGLTIDVAPGAVTEVDPRSFALMALATAAGHEVVPRSLLAPKFPSELLRARTRQGGAACTAELERFRALAALDHPWLDGLLAQTVALGPPPTFEPVGDPEAFALPRDRDGRFAELPGLLAAYWTCANLGATWGLEQEAYLAHGQDLLTRAGPELGRARTADSSRWPATVRLVPNLLDRPGRVLTVSRGDEVTLFVGPPTGLLGNEPVDPAAVVHGALHHAVDPVVVGRGCAPLDAAFAAVAPTPGLAPQWTATDTWVAESVVRAMALRAGALPAKSTAAELRAAWVKQGFPLVPAIEVALGQKAAGVWVDEQCGGG